MKLGNEYSDLNRNSLGTYQWEKLEKYKTLKKCYIHYLFYNGVQNFTHLGINKCSINYNEEQFGLSYVDTKDVERIALSKNKWNFSDFHPKLANPLSELVCCLGTPNSNVSNYDYQTIVETLNKYQKLEYLADINKQFAKAEEIKKSSDDNNKDEKDREAEIVIVIRNTSSAY